MLRHQLAVLRRQPEQPQLTNDDQTLLGAIAAALPHPRRIGWLVTPETCSAGTDAESPDTGPNPTGHQDGHPPPP